MNDELLTTFDDNGNITGTAPRDEVHRLGLWHETFHCWFVSKEQDMLHIYLQLRSELKKIMPVCWISRPPDIYYLMRFRRMASVRCRRSLESALLLSS